MTASNTQPEDSLPRSKPNAATRWWQPERNRQHADDARILARRRELDAAIARTRYPLLLDDRCPFCRRPMSEGKP